jgi:hypothetical protein
MLPSDHSRHNISILSQLSLRRHAERLQTEALLTVSWQTTEINE